MQQDHATAFKVVQQDHARLERLVETMKQDHTSVVKAMQLKFDQEASFNFGFLVCCVRVARVCVRTQFLAMFVHMRVCAPVQFFSSSKCLLRIGFYFHLRVRVLLKVLHQLFKSDCIILQLFAGVSLAKNQNVLLFPLAFCFPFPKSPHGAQLVPM